MMKGGRPPESCKGAWTEIGEKRSTEQAFQNYLRSGEQVLARFARDRMAPGEMERIAVPRVLLDKADAEQALVVEVQEETP